MEDSMWLDGHQQSKIDESITKSIDFLHSIQCGLSPMEGLAGGVSRPRLQDVAEEGGESGEEEAGAGMRVTQEGESFSARNMSEVDVASHVLEGLHLIGNPMSGHGDHRWSAGDLEGMAGPEFIRGRRSCAAAATMGMLIRERELTSEIDMKSRSYDIHWGCESPAAHKEVELEVTSSRCLSADSHHSRLYAQAAMSCSENHGGGGHFSSNIFFSGSGNLSLASQISHDSSFSSTPSCHSFDGAAVTDDNLDMAMAG